MVIAVIVLIWAAKKDDVFSLRDVNRKDIDLFIEQANTFHPTIKFTAEISEKEITLLVTVVYKGDRFLKEAILDFKNHYKLTETFQYTEYLGGSGIWRRGWGSVKRPPKAVAPRGVRGHASRGKFLILGPLKCDFQRFKGQFEVV